MSRSLSDNSSRGFVFCGIVAGWDPTTGQLQVALETLWVPAEVACTSLAVGTRVVAMGHRDFKGRRVVTELRILTG